MQPKRTNEDRKHLVAMLPSLLKRVEAGTHGHTWEAPERDQFMANLVEAHAAAVKPSLANAESPAAAVAEIAKVQAEAAKAAGDEQAAERAHALAEAMATAEPLPAPELPDVIDDDYIEIARNLDRGMWIEFENEDGQLAFAKLAWSARCAAPICSPTARGKRPCRCRPRNSPSVSALTRRAWSRPSPCRPRAFQRDGKTRTADRRTRRVMWRGDGVSKAR